MQIFLKKFERYSSSSPTKFPEVMYRVEFSVANWFDVSFLQIEKKLFDAFISLHPFVLFLLSTLLMFE